MNTGNGNVLGFPSDFAPKAEKGTDAYGLKYAQAIWWSFGGFSFFDQRKARFAELRRWAEGTQSTEDMKDLMSTGGDTSNLNLDWSPISIIPKFVDIIVSRITSSIYSVHCSATDPVSTNIKDKAKKDLYVNMYLAQLEKQAGVKLVPEGAYVPESANEIDLYMDLTYKMAVEVAMELGIQYIFDKNKFEEICYKIVYDIVTIKQSGVRIGYTQNGRIEMKYLDPLYTITPLTQKDDFSDIPYYGYVDFITLGQLKREAGDTFSEEQYFQIAQSVNNLYGNAVYGSLQPYYYYYSENNRFYYNFLIPVLDFEFLTIRTNSYKSKASESGGRKLYDIENKRRMFEIKASSEQEAIAKLREKFNSEAEEIKSAEEKKKGTLYKIEFSVKYSPDNENTQVVEKNIQDKYAGRWIINTDFIYNYGLAKNMLRTKEMGKYNLDTTLGCKLIAPNMRWMENKSHVERAVPYARQMQLAHLKLQQMQAKARPKGLFMDISGLQEVMLGRGGAKSGQEKAATPLELQAIYDQTGNLYGKRLNTDGSPMNGLPIHELENGLGKDIMNYINIYNHNLKILQDMLGVPEGADASSPDGNTPVFGMKQSSMASQQALMPLVKSYVRLVENTAGDAALMIQDAIGDDVNSFSLGIGEANKIFIELSKEIPLCEFGIKIEYYPDEQSRLYVEQRIAAAENKGELRFEDALMGQFIKNPKLLSLYMANRRKQYQQEAIAEATKRSQDQAAAAAQAAQVAEKAKQETIALQAKMDVDKMMKEYLLKEGLEKSISENKIREIQEQGRIDYGINRLQSDKQNAAA